MKIKITTGLISDLNLEIAKQPYRCSVLIRASRVPFYPTYYMGKDRRNNNDNMEAVKPVFAKI